MDLHGGVLKPEDETLISCGIMDLDHMWSQNCQTMPNFMEEMTKDVKLSVY